MGEGGHMVGDGGRIAFRSKSDSHPTKCSSSVDCIGPFLFQESHEF